MPTAGRFGGSFGSPWLAADYFRNTEISHTRNLHVGNTLEESRPSFVPGPNRTPSAKLDILRMLGSYTNGVGSFLDVVFVLLAVGVSLIWEYS